MHKTYYIASGILAVCFSCNTREHSNQNSDDNRIKGNTETSYAYSKTVSDSTSSLIQLFSNKGTPIPDQFCSDYFMFNVNSKSISGFYTEGYRKLGRLDIFIVNVKCTAGAICESVELFVFDNGILKSNMEVGLHMADNGFDKIKSYHFTDNVTIKIVKEEREYEKNYNAEDNEKVLTNETSETKYYVITEDGVIKIKENTEG